MARKGSRKVRTGCFTCKHRKVKCDEAKPECLKCTSTGRKCDGYPAQPSFELRPILPQNLGVFPGISSQPEGRALQFFCEVAGPSLPGGNDPFFWTHLIMQFSRFEPAVRHSMIAISSLYEDVSREQTKPSYLRNQKLKNNSLALRHYNAAIKELLTMDNPSLVLLVCLLFVCIELLQSNRKAALRHCTHGTALLSKSDASTYHWVKQYLTPIFRRLSALPFFFGRSSSELLDLSASAFAIPPRLSTLTEAQAMIDDIFNQSFLLLRHGDPYRLGHLQYKTPTAELIEEQEKVKRLLEYWYTMFTDLDARSTSPDDQITGIPRLFAIARYRVCRIWMRQAFIPSEMGYDEYRDEFAVLVQELAHGIDYGFDESRDKTFFQFEMGFIAPLSFILLKCRFLDLRLEALRLFRALAAHQEALWEKDAIYALCRRVVEVEHGLVIDKDGRPLSGIVTRPGPPPDHKRVHHYVAEFLEGRHNNFRGYEIRGKKAVFLMRTPKGRVYLRPEVLSEEAEVPQLPTPSPEPTTSPLILPLHVGRSPA